MVERTSIEDLTNEVSRLRIRLSIAENELAIATRRAENDVPPALRQYEEGDGVRITNRIVRSAQYEGEWDEHAKALERQATVTSIVAARGRTPTQVWIITDNGTRTWRAPKHLEPLR